ncbi:MAG: EAL domain-containing protein [Acidimicrobiales bacterium]|nr:EAL domain-containing protein [Acidimicrobiales bacterium]MCB9394699.1 EAL domain-containing protein [Acidimicrobiaceae bacterium]
MVARLLAVGLVPLFALVQVGWSDVRREEVAVDASEDLARLVAFEQRVAAVAAPRFVEHLAHVGLAAVDAFDVDRGVIADLTGVDYEAIYEANIDRLDDALASLRAVDGDLTLQRTGRLGDGLDEVRAEIAGIRAQTEARAGDRTTIDATFSHLELLLDDALESARLAYTPTTVPLTLKRYRAESTSLTWVLASAGDLADAILSVSVDPGRHRERLAAAGAAHQQAIAQFRDLLPPGTAASLDEVVSAAPDLLTPVPEEVDLELMLSPDWARTVVGLVLGEMNQVEALSAWADDYYGEVRSTVEASADASRTSLERTTVLLVSMVALVLALVAITARSILRPLLALGRRAAAIGHGELALAPLPVRGPSVLRSLTATMNAMLAALRQVDRQAAALAAGRLDDPSLAEESPGRLGSSIRTSVDRLTGMTAQLQASEERASAIVSHASFSIWTIDEAGRITSANGAAARALGVPADAQLGRRLGEWISASRGECEVRRADGSHVWLDVEHTDVTTTGGPMRTVIAEEVTERKEFERRLAHQARSDALTGLPNRFAVLERLAQLSDAGRPTSVLFIDVDGFKSVNDTKGHGVGDLVLVEIARRLQTEIRAGGMVARLGGDEFVVVVDDLPDEHAVVRLGRRLIERVEQPYEFDDSLFGISASIGVATMLPGDAPLDVIHRADAAVYHAKDLGRARVEVFDQEFQARVERRAEMELAMREAIGRGDLEMHLQPVWDLTTGRPVGAEALARWERPGIGYVQPSEFVAIAESSSLIIDLTRSMLGQACDRIAAWRDHDPSCTMRIAVNLSGRHLIDGDLIGDLVEALSVSGADPRLLELELTETQLLADLEPARLVLETVRAMGVTVAVDDFGTGFSSMAYLRQLQVDVIKVDRSFVAGAGPDGLDATAIDAMVNFGRVLGVHVVAEGVETPEQLAFVIEKGCTRAQGFLLGRPLPVDDTERVLFAPDHGWSTLSRLLPTVAVHAGRAALPTDDLPIDDADRRR